MKETAAAVMATATATAMAMAMAMATVTVMVTACGGVGDNNNGSDGDGGGDGDDDGDSDDGDCGGGGNNGTTTATTTAEAVHKLCSLCLRSQEFNSRGITTQATPGALHGQRCRTSRTPPQPPYFWHRCTCCTARGCKRKYCTWYYCPVE